MKRIMALTLISALLFTGCNIPQNVPKIDGTFNSVSEIKINADVENLNKENTDKDVYELKENFQRLGKETYGYIDIPIGWYSSFNKDISIDFLQYTDGSGKSITIYPYRRAEVVGNAEKMSSIFKETLPQTGATVVSEKIIELKESKVFATYFYYEETKSSAALFLIDELIENNIKDKDYVKYIFMESNLPDDQELFSYISSYSLNSFGINTDIPEHTDKNTTQTIFVNSELAGKNMKIDNLVEIQNKKHNFTIIPPSDYSVIRQDKFLAELTNEKYKVNLSFLDLSEADYIRTSALSKYHFYLAKYLDYSNSSISNDTVTLNNGDVASRYIVKYRYDELKQNMEYHYYAIPLGKGLYVVEVENHYDNNFEEFDINGFLKII